MVHTIADSFRLEGVNMLSPWYVAEQKVAVYMTVLNAIKSCNQEYLRYSFKIF